MKIKLVISILFTLLFLSKMLAQENVFLSRDYWKSNPTVEQIKKDIKEGNNPSELNENAFDAVIYALLEKVDNTSIKFLLTQEGNPVEKRTHDSRTYIFWAAYKGNVEIMDYLFDKGAVINLTDSHGNTPITFAAVTGQMNTEVYDSFEKNGAQLNQEKNENGANSLLLIAPYLNNEKELTYFTQKGFTLKDKDAKGNTIFNYAAKKGNIEFLKLLLEKGVNPKLVNSDGGNAILYASQGTRNFQNTIEVYVFLENLGIKVGVVGDNGRNPLHAIAYRNDDMELFSYFIDKEVDVNLQDEKGVSPFMNAVSRNKLNAVKFLSEHVNNFNVKDNKGLSALALAVNRNTPEVVEFLINKGADTQTKDEDENTLAYYLLNTFKAEDTTVFEAKFKLLKKHGLDLKQTQNGGNTLLHIAAEKNNLALLMRLATLDIDINTKNTEGYTALHLAAMKADNDKVLKYLLDKGADKSIKTEFDETALDLASENELLQKQHINLNFL